MNPLVLSVEDELLSVWKNVKILHERLVNESGDSSDIIDKYKIGFTREDLREQIRVMNEKLQYKRTVIGIFEKNRGEPMLVDRLLKEKLSKVMNEHTIYILIEDGLSRDISTMDMLESIKFITRPQSLSPILKSSIVVSCQKDFAEYFDDENRKRLPDPDLVILVLNSPKDLEKYEIKNFLFRIGRKYNQRNFILVLNNAKREECTKFMTCDNCYPEAIRLYMEETGLKIDGHIFKVSTTSKYFELKIGMYKSGYFSNSFKHLQKSIENSLNRKEIEERYKERVRQLKINLIQFGLSINLEMYKSSMTYQPINLTIDFSEEIITNAGTSENSVITRELVESKLKIWDSCENDFGMNLVSLKRNKSMKSDTQKTKQLTKRSQSSIGPKKKITGKETIQSDKVFLGIREGVKDVVENAIEKVSKYKNTIERQIKYCDEFFAIIDVNRLKINFKEKIIDDTTTMSNKIEENLKTIEGMIDKKEMRNIFPNYFGRFIVNSIYSTNVNLDIDEFETHIVALSQNTQSNEMIEKLKFLQESINNIRSQVKLCQEKFTIFLGTLNQDEFYDDKKKKNQRFMRDSIRTKYEELCDFFTNQNAAIRQSIHELITPFELAAE